MLENDSSLLDVGCGTGDLLFKAKNKIRFGLGVDLDQDMISFANEKNKSISPKILEFVQEDINSCKELEKYEIDIASSTLCLHEMLKNDAIKTLQSLSKISSRILIADYSKPKSLLAKVSIELDEMISGHYGRFKEYRNNGYLPGLATGAGLVVISVNETPIDGILIWELRREIHA